MSREPPSELVSRWYGVYLLLHGRVERSELFPTDRPALEERRRLRRAGRLAPEEERIARAAPKGTVSRDRRFEVLGILPVGTGGDVPTAAGAVAGLPDLRDLILQEAVDSLKAGWDPSVHVEEAVRAMADLDRVLNLVAERLTSWAGRDAVVVEAEVAGSPARIARSLVDDLWRTSADLPAMDPTLASARRALAQLYLDIQAARRDLEATVDATMPGRAANLSQLLGPELAARLISQAGGLARLARLPSSTVQVLGAEKAFFAHLRGTASPPRHGLLFLHPSIQSARRPQRGKLARALAGKVSIAARMDLGGAPVDPGLKASFERRAEAIRAQKGARPGGRSSTRLRPPLDRTAEHR